MKYSEHLTCWAAAFLLTAGTVLAQTESRDSIIVRMVAAEMPDRLISDLESSVTVEEENLLGRAGMNAAARPASIGDDATLWVRRAAVDGTNTFERFYLGKYIDRKSELTLANPTPGEHVIDPGRHVFRVAQDGAISSDDPDISINGRIVTLKTYRIDIFNVDGDKAGPPETRLLGRPLGVSLLPLDTPDRATGVLSNAAINLVFSDASSFCPLRIYLPANTNGAGYLLTPCKQQFHVLPGGKVAFTGSRVFGLVADATRIIVPYLTISAWVNTRTGLSANFNGVSLPETVDTPASVRIYPTRGDPFFTAGVEGLSPRFGLSLSEDYSRYPAKFMVADNMHKPSAIRLMTLESGGCVFERGATATVRLQYKGNVMAITPDEIQGVQPLAEAMRATLASRAPPPKSPASSGKKPAPAEKNPPPAAKEPEPAAKTNLPVQVSAPARRVCDYVLSGLLPKDVKALSAWLDLQVPAGNSEGAAKAITQDAAARIRREGLPVVLTRCNELLYERAFFDPKELAALTMDDALRADAARLATLDEVQLLRTNRRLLDLIFPGLFLPPPSAVPPRPTVRLACSPYNPVHNGGRSWTYFDPQSWVGDTLTFQTPNMPFGFYIFRVMLYDQEDRETVSSLRAEFAGCIIEPNQEGTASFVSNKGRDAFAPGETIRLQAVLRSRSPRPAGERTAVLRHPDGREDRLTFQDPGGKWHSQTLTIPESITRRLLPGRYELSVSNLPPTVVCYPFRFDLAAPRESLFRIIQSSGSAGTWFLKAVEGLDNRERSIASFAELGYNRYDFWNYTQDHHTLPADPRAVLAEGDERLMPSDALYLPSPRDQILNACVRQGLEFSDVLHVAGDSQIPRYIDGYINAAERWIRREVTSMRHSPAFDGMYMYQEAYESGLVGVPPRHDTFFPAYRQKLAMDIFTNKTPSVTPSRIRTEISQSVTGLKTGAAKWDLMVMERFLKLRKWEMHGWGDFNTRVADAGRDLLPRARMGTYHKPFLFVQNGYGAVMSATDFDCGYHPDVFENLDIASSEHYHDGPTLGFWPHSPILIALKRESPVGGKRLAWANIGMHQESRTLNDGQLQRQMAFAMLQEGADGISHHWVPQSFTDGPNPDMIKAKETTRWLNKEILAPFGEVVSRSRPGYLKVGIVNTLAQLSMSEFKSIRTANQLEELWIACWRMGYPSVFLREPDLEKALDGYQVIFVPGIRFKGELTAAAVERLKTFAATPGCKVVVERDSTLDAEIPGVTKLKDFDLMNYFLGAGYNPAATDDELERVFDKSQPAVDYLGPKMAQWGIEAAARGPFKVGPNWRTSGGIHYLIMSNYEDPDYEQTCKDIMAKPVRMPLTVPAHRGEAAYDLLARAELPLGRAGTNNQERSLVLDMTRCQGALVAFLPEKIAALRATARFDAATGAARLNGTLVGESGKTLTGLIPVRIRLLNDKGHPLFSLYRALDSEKDLELTLPVTTGGLTLEVTENISGRICNLPCVASAGTETALRLEDARAPFVPYPSEVARFLKSNTNALLVVGRGLEGSKADVDRLIAGLGAKGLKVTAIAENRAWRAPSGDPSIIGDPLADGFHTWSASCSVVAPRANVDSPLILLSAARGSFLLNSLSEKGFLTEVPTGKAGVPMQPTLQVASRGLHPKYDTLCLVANDGEGVRAVVSRVLEGPPASAEKPPSAPSYGQPEKRESRETTALPTALSFMGNNEYVLDMKFDAATNVYIITWGHGDNLYSLDPRGKLRFSRRLPEMGACRLDMDVDRVVVFTAYGSRLYQVALDGKPISQAQLTLDPGVNDRGSSYRERPVPELLRHGLDAPEMNLYPEPFQYTYVPGKRHIIYFDPLLKTMRVLDANYNPITDWQGAARTDTEGDASRTSVGESACSPDGTKIAVIEENTLVLRDLGNPALPKLRERPDVWGRVSWRVGEPGPTVDGTHYNANLEPVWEDAGATPDALYNLPGMGGLVADGTTALRLVRMTKEGPREFARFAPFDYFPTFVQASPDRRHIVFLDEYWNAFVHDAESGKRVGQITLPEMGFALTFTPDSQRFLVGGLRGAVMCCDLNGRLVWNTSLAAHNRSLKQGAFARVDAEFPDGTAKLFKPAVDEPGDLDKLVTLDSSRLVNGDCEATAGWQVVTNAGPQTARVVYSEGGHQGKRCLKVGDAPVQQEVEGLLGEHFTWVLEFFHRSASPDKTVGFLAGLNVSNRYPDSVVGTMTAGPEWRFARMVLKSGADPVKMGVGFQAQDGEVLIDDITLRRIRFPSVNHMFHPPVYDVEPVILHNPLFQRDYDPLGGTLREQIPNIVLAQRNDQIANALLTDSFLQNGRLNDVSSDWYNAPLPTPDTRVSLGLTKTPRWISMVALYFNAYDQTNTTRHFDIYVSDVDQKRMVSVASVRNNRSLFRIVKFPPRRVDQVVVMLVNTLPRQQTLTEVEIYGPMSGSEKVGFVDAEGQNTYMGAFDRVEKRVMTVATECALMAVSQQTVAPRWAVPTSQIMMADRNLYLSRALGFNERSSLDALGANAPATFRTGSMGFSPYITLYGGVLLKPGSDGNLYCIDPQSGRQFWSRKLGERLVGGPVAIGLDLYLASDTGRLYTLDLASGAILAERPVSGPVLGSLATDDKNLYFISTDGRLHAVPAAGGPELWSREVARNTESTPAVAGGVVFVADQKGTAQAVQSADGKVLWSRELGDEFVRCPVVLSDRVVFGCGDGRLTALDRRTGEALWQSRLNTRFLSYDPVPLQLTAPRAADPAAGATNTAAAPAVPPVSAEMTPVLLCMSWGRPNLIDVRTGQPTERQLMSVTDRRDGKGAPAAGSIPGIGELMAPISYYKGYLTFVPILFDDRPSEPMYNYNAYDRVFVGTAQILVPVGDSASKPATGPNTIASPAKPVRVDGFLGEWSAAETVSLDGPEGILPADRVKQGAAEGSVTWTGYDDFGAKVYLSCDSNFLYVAVRATDDRHFNAKADDQIWDGDALQLGFVIGKDVHSNFGLALTQSGVVFHQFAGTNALADVASRSVVRNEASHTTSYELSLPLSALGVQLGDEIGFNIAVLDDDDGKGMRYWMSLAPGLLGRDAKTPPPAKIYPRFVLTK